MSSPLLCPSVHSLTDGATSFIHSFGDQRTEWELRADPGRGLGGQIPTSREEGPVSRNALHPAPRRPQSPSHTPPSRGSSLRLAGQDAGGREGGAGVSPSLSFTVLVHLVGRDTTDVPRQADRDHSVHAAQNRICSSPRRPRDEARCPGPTERGRAVCRPSAPLQRPSPARGWMGLCGSQRGLCGEAARVTHNPDATHCVTLRPVAPSLWASALPLCKMGS